jgi:hypothetical protein
MQFITHRIRQTIKEEQRAGSRAEKSKNLKILQNKKTGLESNIRFYSRYLLPPGFSSLFLWN